MDRLVRLAVELEQHLVEAGAQADEVALLHRHLVLRQHVHQVRVADHLALAAVMRVQVDHHGAALHAGARHVLDAEPGGTDMAAGRDLLAAAIVDRPDHVLAGAEAVVEHHFGLAVAIDIELLAHMCEAVPLRRILQRQQHDVVAYHVDELRVVARKRIGHVRLAGALGRREHRRLATRIEDAAARIVERHREAERQALAHLGDALLHLLGRDQVEPAELIVGTEVAPGGACGFDLPTRIGHAKPPGVLIVHRA